MTDIGGVVEEETVLSELAASADWTVLIAPETDGALRDRCLLVGAAGGRLLSPGPLLVEMASDKHRTGRRLAAAGVATPHAIVLGGGCDALESFPYPAVVKPRFGAGSVDVRFAASPQAVRPWESRGDQIRLERYCEGVGASVAFLCGSGRDTVLPAVGQRLSADGRFRYLGGVAPLAEPLARRAETLALSALRAVPPAIGYVGIDLVLSPQPDGSGDVVIEVNPRLTTSYIGLRKLALVNLAEAMLAIAEGRHFRVSFSRDQVAFDADGTVH
jgi:predicted ATP-grasp superfamily ATP-dependent carboligase